MCPEFLWGGQEEWNHLEDNSVNNRTVLKWIIKEIGGGGMDSIHLAEDRDKLWTDVCTLFDSLGSTQCEEICVE